MKNLYFAATAIIILALGCGKYETQYDGPYNPGEVVTPPRTYDLVYVQGGKIKMANEFLSYFKTITVPETNVKYVSISPNHTKLAYKEASGSIIVIDSSGNNRVVVPNSSSAVDFAWFDNDVLYYANISGQLSFYGGSLNVHTTTLKKSSSDIRLHACAILPDLSLVFITTTSTGQIYLVRDKPTGTDRSDYLSASIQFSRLKVYSEGFNTHGSFSFISTGTSTYRTFIYGNTNSINSSWEDGLFKGDEYDKNFEWDGSSNQLSATVDGNFYIYDLVSSDGVVTDLDF